MARRPRVTAGQYYRTRKEGAIVCKAYDAPPFKGTWKATLEKGITVGPVEEWVQDKNFTTILVRGYWINIWAAQGKRNGVSYAFLVDNAEVQEWKARGWRD